MKASSTSAFVMQLYWEKNREKEKEREREGFCSRHKREGMREREKSAKNC